jgi:hypothetical protein
LLIEADLGAGMAATLTGAILNWNEEHPKNLRIAVAALARSDPAFGRLGLDPYAARGPLLGRLDAGQVACCARSSRALRAGTAPEECSVPGGGLGWYRARGGSAAIATSGHLIGTKLPLWQSSAIRSTSASGSPRWSARKSVILGGDV